MIMDICYKSIGKICTPFKKIKGMPIQSKGSIGIKGTIELKRTAGLTTRLAILCGIH